MVHSVMSGSVKLPPSGEVPGCSHKNLNVYQPIGLCDSWTSHTHNRLRLQPCLQPTDIWNIPVRRAILPHLHIHNEIKAL